MLEAPTPPTNPVAAKPLAVREEMVDPNLHSIFQQDMVVKICEKSAAEFNKQNHLEKPIKGIALSILEFSQSPYHRYVLFDGSETEMVRFDNCVVCNNTVKDVVCSTDKAGHQFMTYGLCPCCGHFQHSLRPKKEYYKEFYAKNWDPTRQNVPAPTAEQIQPNHYPLIHLNHMLPRGGKVLEIGAGFGHSLKAFQQNGFQCVALEASEHRADAIQNALGIPVFRGPAETIPLGIHPFQEESFDLITSNHVIEHVYNPREVIAHLTPLLKPNGLMFVCIPNYYQENLSCHSGDLSHTVSFSRENFDLLLMDLGYDIVADHSDRLNIMLIARKSKRVSKESFESRLNWLKTFLPHRGLAYVLEKNGLSRLPDVLSSPVELKMNWYFRAYGRVDSFLMLRYNVSPQQAAMVKNVRDIIQGRGDIVEALEQLPIHYVYPSTGVPLWYY